MFKRIALIALALVLLTGTAMAEKTIVFATDSTWPPMEFVDENKNIVGFAIDYMTAAGKLAGFKAEFKAVAWDGIFAGLAGGQYDAICSSVSITEERKKKMDFSEPYFKVRQALVVKKGLHGQDPAGSGGEEGRHPDQHHRHLCRAKGEGRGLQDL